MACGRIARSKSSRRWWGRSRTLAGFPGEQRPERAWILNLYTEPEVRRQGIAKRLLAVIIAWCRSQGYNTVSLHASPAGRPLYEAFGFEQTNEMRLKLH